MSSHIAKTVLLSTLIALVILTASIYLSRDFLLSYVVSKTAALPEPAQQVLPNLQSDSVVSMIEKVNDAVVSVVVTKDVPVYERYYEVYNPWGLGSSFSVPRVRENGTEEREVGGGSGFFVSNDGLIVTNRHVVSDTGARYSVLLNNGTSYGVDVLAVDKQLDIAILKISDPLEEALSFVSFGDSEQLKLGETVVAIGNALAEFRNSVSVGVVSGLARSIAVSDRFGRSEQLDQVIQTDAAINPGNSGGPLLNLKGEVIGVNVATSQGADNIGFALPAHLIKGVVESVREYGEIVRPFLGIRYAMVSDRMAKLNNLPVNYGALVVRGDSPEDLAVIPGSPADKAGISEGVIILEVDSEELINKDLSAILRKKEVGEEVLLLILKEGERKTVAVTLEKA